MNRSPRPKARRLRCVAPRVALVSLLFPLIAGPSAAGTDPDPYGPDPKLDAPRRSQSLTHRAGEKRPEDQLRFTLFGRPLTVGGEFEVRTRYRANPRLEPDRDSDEVTIRPGVELELFYEVSPSVAAFVEGKLSYDADLYQQDGAKERDWEVKRGETWLHLADIRDSGFSLQLGRQNFKDKREWWWDEDLDAIRGFYEWGDFDAELALTHELGPDDFSAGRTNPEVRQVLFLLGRTSWHWDDRNRLDLFFAHRNDFSETHDVGDVVDVDREDERDAELTWVGLRARGRQKFRPLGAFYYWTDVAFVFGEETELDFDELPGGRYSEVDSVSEFDDVRGWGLDLGVTWVPADIPLPRITLGYAYGSGDGSPTSGSDGSFRQTGLQDNNAKFRGVNRFRYYGELFRPELSNMHIVTGSVGIRWLESSSIELMYHLYRQDEASASLRNSRLKATPGGGSRQLGQEIDLVIGLEEWRRLEIEIIGSVFLAGSAFGPDDGEVAGLGILKIDYNF
jgi:hypothetical protein